MEHGFLPGIKVYFFDLDGCIYHGDRLDPWVIPLLDRLRRQNTHYAFLTNNSRLSAAEIGEKLASMGLHVPSACILPVTDIAGAFIREKYGCVTVKSIGSDSLERSIAAVGHRMVPWNQPAADVVIVGRDTEFHYGKLQQIVADVQSGSRLIATNPDTYHPGPSGERIPETGALLAAIESVTGTTAECIGKPEPYIFLHGMKLYGASPETCVMVGDNPVTDIAGSNRAGLTSIWITNQANGWKQGQAHPDVTVNNLEELFRLVSAGTIAVSE